MSNETEPIVDKKTKIEKIISLAGYGLFSCKLITLCGLVVTSDAIEVLSVSYILPGATCDMNLSDEKKGWINASIFIGMTIGALFWGCLADVYGRKHILVMSLFFNGFFNLASGLSTNYYAFLTFRSLSGFGVGGNVPVIYTYISEFQSEEHRGKIITFVASFWTVGGMLGAGMAWIIMPQKIELAISENYVLKSWNIFLATCSIPSLTSMFLMMFMPESPKYLFEYSKIEDFKKTMKNIFRQNNPKQNISEFEKELLKFDDEDKSHEDEKIPKVEPRARNLTTLFRLLRQLFSSEIIWTTVVVSILFNIQSYGYYGMFMWFPELFNRAEINNGTICMDMDKVHPWQTASNETDAKLCEVPTAVFMQGFMVTFSKLFGYIIVISFIDNIGRKPILSISCILSGLCIFLVWFLDESTKILIASCVFGTVASAVWGAIDVITAESFPSHLRSSAMGFCGSTGRISAALSNLVFGYMLQIYCFLPFLFISGLYWVASVIACFMKETKNLHIT